MVSLDRYEIDDPSFVGDLIQSDSHVRKVAQWIKRCGYGSPNVAEIRIRDRVENMRDFSDDGDIFAFGKRLEAKQRMVNFESRETFPYRTIIVDVAHTWDDAEHKPDAYILTNKQATCCLVVLGSTYPEWVRVQKWDRFKKRTRTFYECPIDHTLFYRMDQPYDLEWLG